MTEDLKELAELQPASSFVVIKDHSFEIKPFKFRHMFAVLNHLSHMVEDISLIQNPYEDPALAQTKQLLRLFGNHEEDVLGILAIAIGKPVSFFDDVDMEEGFELASVVWRINQDFFVRKIQPKLEALGLKSLSQDDSLSEKEKSTLPTDTTESLPENAMTESQPE